MYSVKFKYVHQHTEMLGVAPRMDAGFVGCMASAPYSPSYIIYVDVSISEKVTCMP